MGLGGTQYRSDQLEKVLRTLHAAVPGLKTSIIVNLDGLLVSAYPAVADDDDEAYQHPTSSPQVAAMSATLVGLAIRTLRRLQQGEMKRMLLEAEDGQMIIYPAGESLLAVFGRKRCKTWPGNLCGITCNIRHQEDSWF